MHAPRTWQEARTRLSAADHVLRQTFLAYDGTSPPKEEIHAFADLIVPLNEEEIPPFFKLDGKLPSYDNPDLFLAPFSVRVQPPRTEWIDRKPPQPPPPPDFEPRNIFDLLDPEWGNKLRQWYLELARWLLDIAEISDQPDSERAEAVRRARPDVLVIPRSGFVPPARGTYWDLRGERPKPTDFREDFTSHLNLDLIRQWQTRFPDYPDRELFSHLLEGVRFKADLPYQMVMQPHLASLSRGFVNVHKEIQRLVDKGWFECFQSPPWAPWLTLPNGTATRKLEPDRPRRTTDGTAPRKGKRNSDFLVDSDGVRVLPLNVVSKWPTDDINRGTLALFHQSWQKRITHGTDTLPPPHLVLREPLDTSPSHARPATILLVFSGNIESSTSLARTLASFGDAKVIAIDTVVGGNLHDLLDRRNVARLVDMIRNGDFSFVFLSPPCKSFSVAASGSHRDHHARVGSAARPLLRTRASPRGDRVPAEWADYISRHNQLSDATASFVVAADAARTPWAIENPAHRGHRGTDWYWADMAQHGTLWDLLAQQGIAPDDWDLPVPHVVVRHVRTVTVAACAFGAPYQKYTTFWASHDASPFITCLRGYVCTHRSHPVQVRGSDAYDRSRSALAAAYWPALAFQIAVGIQAVRSSQQLEHSLDSHCRPCGPSRPTVNARPAPQSLRSTVVDVDITRAGCTPILSNPFKLGRHGKTERLRAIACATFREWLAARNVPVRDWPSSLPFSHDARERTGDDVITEVQRIIDKYGHTAAFHLVCARRCVGKLHCHGHDIALLFEQLIDSTTAPPFPKELKPTVPDIMNDLAVLLHLSALTGLMVYQMVSDIKDFFNQHRLAAEDKCKVGFVTLDPRAIVEHATRLRAHYPRLCNLAENVLGYGLFSASNVAQRHAYLLIFVWYVEMLIETSSLVHNLVQQYPVIGDWLDKRRKYLEPPDSSGCARVRFLQSSLFRASCYTDDSHMACLGPDLQLAGVVVWRRITNDLRLTMAIIQKHGLGLQVTTQGYRFNTGLGIVFVPADKARRALQAIQCAITPDSLALVDYHSLLGLLQSLLFVVGLRKSATYGLYTPFMGKLQVDPDEMLRTTPMIVDRLNMWRDVLGSSAGVPFSAAVDHLEEGVHHSESPFKDLAAQIFFIRSDASKEGADLPGVGGALGGLLWRYPDDAPLPDHLLDLPIAVLEFVAYAGSVVAFGSLVPDTALVIAEVDALATSDTLTEDAAKSELMQHAHLRLQEQTQFKRVQERQLVCHIFGDANVMADGVSRGKWEVIKALGQQLGLVISYMPAPSFVSLLLEELHQIHTGNVTSNRAVASASRHSTSVHLGLAADAVAQPDYDMASSLGLSAAPLDLTGWQVAASLPQHAPAPTDRSGYSLAGFSAPYSSRAPPWHSSLSHSVGLSAAPLGASVARPTPPPTQSLALEGLRPSGDLSIADHVACMLESDTSSLALRPGAFSLHQLCTELYDPSTAQPASTSAGQDSAWKHWSAWCLRCNTDPWRITRHATDVEFHREAVLQAGFLRFCHIRQSAKPRNGRKAALASSALKTLCHIRKMHKDRHYPMCSSSLVTTQVRRLNLEYKYKYGVADLIPKRKEPFTREILVDGLLATPPGFCISGSWALDWLSRSGRSLRGLICTMAQTGFRKRELVAADPAGAWDPNCLPRSALSFLLRGKIYSQHEAPDALLRNPRPGDFAVLQPGPTKSDPFDMIWGGNPIWLPVQLGEPLCAFSALADMVRAYPVAAEAALTTALFTTDDGLPILCGCPRQRPPHTTPPLPAPRLCQALLLAQR